LLWSVVAGLVTSCFIDLPCSVVTALGDS
jgi:hypothetical protein